MFCATFWLHINEPGNVDIDDIFLLYFTTGMHVCVLACVLQSNISRYYYRTWSRTEIPFSKNVKQGNHKANTKPETKTSGTRFWDINPLFLKISKLNGNKGSSSAWTVIIIEIAMLAAFLRVILWNKQNENNQRDRQTADATCVCTDWLAGWLAVMLHGGNQLTAGIYYFKNIGNLLIARI